MSLGPDPSSVIMDPGARREIYEPDSIGADRDLSDRKGFFGFGFIALGGRG